MNKAPETISRRQSDLINEINARSNERVGDVINDFANRHYLSESTVWKDYKSAARSDDHQSPDETGSNSKRY